MRDYGVYEHPTFFVVDENGEENLGRYDRRVNSEVVTDCFSGSVTGQRMVGETLYFLNTDGVDIDGFVMKPVGYEPGKRYPGILHIHGGPKMVFGPGFHHEMQLWVASGFFVCYCNPRGSCGKGNAFADLQGKYGEVDFRDLMEFTDEVLRRYPEIDADRMGVAGGSYGGFMTNWVIGHTDRFRCAVSQRSIANYVGDYLLSDIGYYYVPDQQLGTIWEHPERLWKASPLTYADPVKTPTLFIHADKDYRCTLANDLEMFAALKLHGVESKLCMFYGENHGLSREGKPSNRISRLSEILHWMEEHLKEEYKTLQAYTDGLEYALHRRVLAECVPEHLPRLNLYPLEAVFFTWRFQRTAATAPRHTGTAEAFTPRAHLLEKVGSCCKYTK